MLVSSWDPLIAIMREKKNWKQERYQREDPSKNRSRRPRICNKRNHQESGATLEPQREGVRL